MADRESSVAVFDSGLGGISVLRELLKVLPDENYIYYGDTKNAPYGTKSVEEVRALTISAYERLRKTDIKAFVIACNTATSAAVSSLRAKYPDDIIIGIEPAVKPAASCLEHPTVAVLGTPLTLSEEKFQALSAAYGDRARLIPVACPGIVELVERGEIHGERVERLLDELLSPLKSESVDAVVLGCTHYPFVKDEIVKCLGSGVLVFDGALGTAKQTRRRLLEADLLRNTHGGEVVYIDSSYPDRMTPEKSMLVKLGGEYLCNLI